jgi:hypothetical protein
MKLVSLVDERAVEFHSCECPADSFVHLHKLLTLLDNEAEGSGLTCRIYLELDAFGFVLAVCLGIPASSM